MVLTLDLSKAFDSVCHQILIYKLFKIGFDWKTLLWFSSYLSYRKQYVKEGLKCSEKRELTVAVPQGSILGPLLFSIFINDLTSIDINGNIVLYADDCNIVYSAENTSDLQNKVQSSIDKINEWMCENRLKLNVKKSNYIIIDFSGRKTDEIQLKFGDNYLEKVKTTKILGLIIDERISFKSHIDSVCNKLSSRIGLLSRISYYLPSKTLNIIYKTLVQTHIDYCIGIYGFTFDTHIKRIQRLQNRAMRVITRSDKDYSQLFKEYNWKTFIQRRNYFSFIKIYKCLNGLAPNDCKDIFKYKDSKVKTRAVSGMEVTVPSKITESFGKSVFYSGVIEYNKLNKDIRSEKDFKIFIRKIRSF